MRVYINNYPSNYEGLNICLDNEEYEEYYMTQNGSIVVKYK